MGLVLYVPYGISDLLLGNSQIMEGAFVSPLGKALPMLPVKVNAWSFVSNRVYLLLNHAMRWSLLSDACQLVEPQGQRPLLKTFVHDRKSRLAQSSCLLKAGKLTSPGGTSASVGIKQ